MLVYWNRKTYILRISSTPILHDPNDRSVSQSVVEIQGFSS